MNNSKSTKKHSNKFEKKKQIQSVLTFPTLSNKSTSLKTCNDCKFVYYPFDLKNKKIHEEYHLDYLHGLRWLGCFDSPIDTFPIFTNFSNKKPIVNSLNILNDGSKNVEIIITNKNSKKQIRTTQRVLDNVNQDLNASNGSESWKFLSCEISKAFVALFQKRVIGICTTELISNLSQCRWMVLSTQTLLPNEIKRDSTIGISRIWVLPSWRRYGIAKHLLNSVLNHSIYGILIKKNCVFFSQPSYLGGLLAKNFNGITSNTGEILIPVYLEKSFLSDDQTTNK